MDAFFSKETRLFLHDVSLLGFKYCSFVSTSFMLPPPSPNRRVSFFNASLPNRSVSFFTKHHYRIQRLRRRYHLHSTPYSLRSPSPLSKLGLQYFSPPLKSQSYPDRHIVIKQNAKDIEQSFYGRL